ncbi:MAG TPA: protein kinase, partial [Thermoanaerobaculia bacterium]|nr:protein kinase [Thermoanaerobaculia bacterium]
EARAAAALRHPAVCRVFELGQVEGRDFIAMEYLEGETLAARLSRGPVPVPRALAWGAAIAAALEEAHDKGIVHRDLKPGNVVVTPQGEVKVMDFGLARALPGRREGGDGEATWTAGLTARGTLVGTPAYMAPEQLKGQPADEQADVWALGCVLYEMLTGSRPFPGGTATEAVAAVLEREPRWEELPAETPRELRRLLDRCLRKDPARRLRHVGDARLVLEETGDEGAVGELAALPAGAFRRSHLVAAAAVVLLLTSALIVGVVAAVRRPAAAPGVTRLTLALSEDPSQRRTLAGSRTFVPFAISPDGRRVAFVATDRARSPRVYLRELDRFEVRAIPGTEGAGSPPFFSPDGRWIAFGDGERLRKVSVADGTVIEIGRIGYFNTGLWSPRGEILLSARPPGPWRIPAAGGEARGFSELDWADGARVSAMGMLPDGDILALTERADETFLEIVSASPGGRRRLARGLAAGARYLADGYVVFASGPALLALPVDTATFEPLAEPVPVLNGVYNPLGWFPYFELSPTGVLVYLPAEADMGAGYAWVDREGSSAAIPGTGGSFFGLGRLSPNGRELAVSLADGLRREVWIFDLERGTRRLIAAEGENRSPIWTPDGRFVVYQSNREATEGIFRRRADGTGNEDLLVARAARPFPQDWTPDGRLLLFSEGSARGDSDVWLLADGEASPWMTGPFSEHSLDVSPDGRFVAFVSDESGRPNVYVQPFPGPGPRAQVSADGGREPRWGRDGRELFYQWGDDILVAAVEAEPGLRVGEPRVFASGLAGSLADVAADGQRLLMAPEDTAPRATELRVVVGFGEEVKRLAPRP